MIVPGNTISFKNYSSLVLKNTIPWQSGLDPHLKYGRTLEKPTKKKGSFPGTCRDYEIRFALRLRARNLELDFALTFHFEQHEKNAHYIYLGKLPTSFRFIIDSTRSSNKKEKNSYRSFFSLRNNKTIVYCNCFAFSTYFHQTINRPFPRES